MRILAIDPGVPFGFAYFDDKWLIDHGERKQHYESWQMKTDLAAVQFAQMVRDYRPENVFCEEPYYIEGHAAAASGSLVKLSIMVGRLMQATASCGWACPFTLVPVRDWKGQMPDVAVRKRLGDVMGPVLAKGVGVHEMDAVCIGLHVTGQWPG